MTTRGKQRHGRLTIFQAAAVDDARLGNAPFRVLAALGTYSDEAGWCYPAQNTIADRLRITRQAVSKSLKQLEALGYITIHHQYDASNAQRASRYRLCLDMFPEDEPPQSEVAPPATSGVAPPATSGVASPATSGVASPATSGVASPATSGVAQNDPTERPKGMGERRAPKHSASPTVETFTPTEGDRHWAAENFPHVDLALQTDMFLDHARANGRIVKDWSAAWRNWIRKTPQFTPRSGPAEHNRGGQRRAVN